ncbi:septation protein SepH [Nocardiopsis tropica]|uniref:septation protein SepH n=1 Tax=Nocardiopsis tropica TaxID=109330 RepID=UPI00361C3513
MHELRLVAVSEDGTYLVLASAGRGTRFTLPVDDRLRAAVRGQFSRLGQYEIEVENPLRPKEIQARIRSGETAEAISEISGIPIERVRWFEGPVLQEREYIAQQAQRATVRAHGDAGPGPSLGDLVAKRIGAHQLETGDAVWDSWKREDRSWQLKLVFLHGSEERVAHWLYEPRHNSVVPADEEAARFSSPEPDAPSAPGANVTPFAPRRSEAPAHMPRMDAQSAAERRPDHAPARRAPREEPLDDPLPPVRAARPETDRFGDPVRDERRRRFEVPGSEQAGHRRPGQRADGRDGDADPDRDPRREPRYRSEEHRPAEFRPSDAHPADRLREEERRPSEYRAPGERQGERRPTGRLPTERVREWDDRAERPGGTRPEHPFGGPRAEPGPRAPESDRRPAPEPSAPAAYADHGAEERPPRPERRTAPEWPPEGRPARAAEPDTAPPAADPPAQPRPAARRRRATMDLNDTGTPRRAADQAPASPAAVPAVANGSNDRAAAKRKGRGRRASVPSWDEIMFGSKKDE